MRKKLLLLCSEGFPGSFKVITNLKGVLDGIADIHILPIEQLFSLKPSIPNIRIKRRLQKIQTELRWMDIKMLERYANNILFTAWGPPYDVVLSKLNRIGVTPSLIMCSTPGQSELSRHELKDYHNLFNYFRQGKLKYWLLNKRLYDSLAGVTDHAIYFPHTINLGQFANVAPTELSGINVDLFCTTRLGKNILNQVLAFRVSGVNGTLHLNFKNDQLGSIISDIGANVLYHRWIPEAEYYNLVAAMDLSLQATFTESFNYAVAERMCLGIPVITSYDIYLTACDTFLAKYLCVQALDTPSEIGRMIKKIIGDAKLRASLAERCHAVIRRIAEKNNKEAVDFIAGFLE
ncbi:MAG: hypothetical protein JSV98_05235 [candidate division WOR-3 bacterium]|nr:MAG: hypothetical protein JSV98_05235 [candidate division WOR-3 bacterium]